MNDLTIKSGGGDYLVEFVDTVAETLAKVRDISQRVTLIDAGLMYDHPPISPADGYGLDAVESNKNMDSVLSLCSWMQMNGVNKHTTLVAIGGGIIQDIATMAAHLYYRGIKLVLVPTTLLSQADSCIGAKCGINLGGKKNQLGCFHSPSRVIVCREFLDTLDETAIKSGHGEILKLQLIGGEDFMLWTRPEDKGLRTDTSIIRGCLEAKKRVIEADEYETATDKIGRRVLNFGHTFGHALEAVTNNAVPHGIAVAWGIDVANHFNRRYVTEALYQRIKAFIRTHLSWKMPLIPNGAKGLVAAIMRDKKAGAYAVDLVLMDAPGEFKLVLTDWAALERGLTEYLATENVYA